MIELRILGDINLLDTDGNRVDSIVAQPKLFALLAYVTLATPGGAQQRDLLISVFWPELAESNARNALNQSLHRLRQALDPHAVVSHGTNEVGIDHSRLSCDALDFVEAIDAGDFETALSLYRGDLLTGLYVAGSPDFERWLDGERANIRRTAFEAANTLGHGAEDADDLTSAARWYRRAINIIPERGTAVRQLMLVLARAGNPAEAVKVFDRFTARLAEDYGLQPSDETRAVLETIRGPLASDAALRPEAADEYLHAPDRPAATRQPGDASAEVRRSPGPTTRRAPAIRWAVVVAVAAALGIGWWAIEGPAASAPSIGSLVVLPFENLTGDPAQEYFVEGMHEAIIGRLGQIGALRVISRTSAMHYKGTARTVPEIAQELNVEAVVEGSVFRAGDSVRIQVQLIQAAPRERHLWAESYDRDVRNALALQAEVARAVAGEIEVALTPVERARIELAAQPGGARRPDPQAYDAYLKGRYYFARNDEEGLKTAIRYYEEAIAKDSTFAEAYAALAEVLLHPIVAEFESGRAAAQAALRLDPDLPDAHTVLGIDRQIRWDWKGSEAEFQRAIELNPNSAAAHMHYSQLLRVTLRSDEALSEIRRAAELDPLSLRTQTAVGWVLFDQHRYDEAIDVWDNVLEMEPEFGLAIYNRGLAYAMQGRGDEAISASRRATAARLPMPGPGPTFLLGVGYALSGQRDSAQEILREFEVRSADSDPGLIAILYHSLGDDDTALDWLERAYELRSFWLPDVLAEGWLDDLRDHPRFRALSAGMGLP